jgi:predicted phosphodiesterase
MDKQRVWELHLQGYGYRSIANMTGDNVNTIQSFIQRKKRAGAATASHKPIRSTQTSTRTNTGGDIKDAILAALRKPAGLDKEAFVATHDISPRVLEAHIADLRDGGMLIEALDGKYRLQKVPELIVSEHKRDWDGNQRIRFGVVSDTHLCSKYQQLTHLKAIYERFRAEGITTVYLPGDITEGSHMRKGHEYEVFALGADAQVDYVVRNFPLVPGITTEFILGNHDHSHIKNGGVDIGNMIAARRPDMRYLGMQEARIHITPNCTVQLIHPLDGAAYALSYAPQKMMDSFTGGEKPSIMLMGHHHKAFYLFYRNIHAIECGTFCAQTPWMRGKRIAAMMGGWIVEADVTPDGTIERFRPEFLPIYKAIEHDY